MLLRKQKERTKNRTKDESSGSVSKRSICDPFYFFLCLKGSNDDEEIFRHIEKQDGWKNVLLNKRFNLPGIRRTSLKGLQNVDEIVPRRIMRNEIQCHIDWARNKYMGLKTKSGFTFDNALVAVDTAQKNNDINFRPGIDATEEDTFQVFSDLYTKVVEVMHPTFGISPPKSLKSKGLRRMQKTSFERLDSKYVKHVKVSFLRSLSGLPFEPFLKSYERASIFELIKESTEMFGGHFLDLMTTDKEDKNILKGHLLHLNPPHDTEDWPNARAIVVSKDQSNNVIVKVNFIEHVQVIASNKEGDIKTPFLEAKKILNALEKHLRTLDVSYAWDKSYGYLNSKLVNLGFAMTIGIHLFLTEFSKHPLFRPLLAFYGLQSKPRSFKFKGRCKIIELQNVEKFGSSEVEIIERMIESASNIIEMEKCLEEGRDIDDLIPNLFKESNTYRKFIDSKISIPVLQSGHTNEGIGWDEFHQQYDSTNSVVSNAPFTSNSEEVEVNNTKSRKKKQRRSKGEKGTKE